MKITLLVVVLALEPVFVYVMLRKGSACLDVFSSESTVGAPGRETTIIYTLRDECAPAAGPAPARRN